MPRKSAVRARSRANALQVLDFKYDLVQQRKHMKLTQTDVAERMGVRQSTVAEFEKHDSNPTLRTIERYASAVDGTIKLSIEDDCRPDTSSAFREIMNGVSTASVSLQDATRRGSAQSVEFGSKRGIWRTVLSNVG